MNENLSTPQGQYKAAQFCYRQRFNPSKQVQGRRSNLSLFAMLARMDSNNHSELQIAWNKGISDAMEQENK